MQSNAKSCSRRLCIRRGVGWSAATSTRLNGKVPFRNSWVLAAVVQQDGRVRVEARKFRTKSTTHSRSVVDETGEDISERGRRGGHRAVVTGTFSTVLSGSRIGTP